MRNLALIALLAAITPAVHAQRSSASPHFAPMRLTSSRLGSGQTFAAARHSFLSAPVFFADPFYAEGLYSAGYPVASRLPIILLQTPTQATSTPDRDPTPAQPLLIELQGNRYVRVRTEETSRSEMTEVPPSPINRAPTHSAAPELAPVVLIFRDGHREEVSDYTIVDGILYARADYYTSGSWNKKIELKSLNLPDTIASNHSRRIPFQLPTAPNEVIVGP